MKNNSDELHEKKIMSYCSTALCGLLQDDESWSPYVLLKKKKKKKHFRKEGNMKTCDKSHPCWLTFFNLPFYCEQWEKACHDEMCKQQEWYKGKGGWAQRTEVKNEAQTLLCCHISHVHTHTYTHIRAHYKARNQRSMCSAGNNVCMEGPISQSGRKLV